jgi:hypothetical protein
MQAQEVVSMEFVALCGYNTAGAGLLLTVEHNTLVSGNGMTVAGGTLSSSAAPTFGAVAIGGRVGLTMAHNFRIIVLRSLALMAVVGMELRNMPGTSHAARTVRSAVEIVGITQWLGYSHHVSATQQ